MSINAKEKFFNVINTKINNYNETKTKILLTSELIPILEKNSEVCGYSLEKFNKEYYLVRIEGNEKIFDNGIIALNISILAKDKKSLNSCDFAQTIITTNYNSTPKINIVTKTSFKAMQQLLTKRESCDDNFKNKDIMIEDTKVCIDSYNAEFSCIRNNDKLLLESYIHYSPKSYANPFLMLCGNKKINIIYNEDKLPIFCQFDKNANIERFGINPNESVSCLKVIGDVNEEIDFYINSINSFFDKQDKKYIKFVKKKVKSDSKK